MEIESANWMANLPTAVKDLPIFFIAIPGTHDSGSCTITRTSPVSPDSGDLVQKLAKIFGRFFSHFVYNWSVTQHMSIAEQLSHGIRYLDLRIATKPNSSELYFVHGLYGNEIGLILGEVKKFLEGHPEEVVILDFQHFYEFKTEDHIRLISLLNSMYGDKICPVIHSVQAVSLSWMNARGYQVIIIYRDSAAGKGMWQGSQWPTPWPDTTSTAQMLSFLTEHLKQRPLGRGFISQCVLTPDVKFVLCNLFSTLKKKCCEPCNHVIMPWLKEQSPGPTGINVVIADFVQSPEFPFAETVINLNLKLLHKKNSSLIK